MADTPAFDTPDENETEEKSVTFADLGLPDDLLEAVQALGFEHPTAIQEQTIPVLLSGRDVVGVAQTGTGKTAAFGLPLLAQVDPNKRRVQALVLAPTRELALQVSDAISDFAKVNHDLNVLSVYGGSSYVPQIRGLERGAQVVVGTPGRVMDLINKGALDLSHVSYFVLDEADEMLRMGFAEDVETIAGSLTREGRVTALFSATMPPQIRRVADQHMTDPEHISVSNPRSTVSTVKQTFAVVPSRHKIGGLARVLATSDADAAIVFVRTRASAEELALELNARGVQAAAISGDVAQRDREKLIERLRSGFLDVLVATDVAARGLDVERIGLVINFDIPKEIDTYVHRIGRTGRAGREGVALSFVTPRERARLRKIEQATKAHMEEVDLPTPAEVSKLRANRLITQAKDRFAVGRLSVYREALESFKAAQEAGETDMSVDDLVYALLALGVRDPGPTDNDEPDRLNVRDDRRGDRDDRSGRDRGGRDRGGRDRDRGSMPGARRYRVEVGHRDGVKPGAIVGAITGEGGLRGSDLGKIDIYPSFSLVEIAGDLSPEATNRIYDAEVSGRALQIRPDEGPRRGRSEGGDRDRGGYRGGDRFKRGGDRFDKRGGNRFDKRRDGGSKRRRDY
ncbi:MAG: DEAD/DEAH box helicase [Flaviflexus sp.]|uniref:DEAD/DEAH box helicase n=1 Tax=Flaviflexus sp. TaxID=1969482 RepID=UPI00352BECBE